jgi:1-acyl-sn-glycerol-3-phosphate acyltransferase
MSVIRKIFRWILLILLLIIGAILTILFLRNTIPPQGFSSKIITTWLATVAYVLGVRIKTFGKQLSGKTLFVANHISWLDILILGGLTPIHFLAKHEVESMPVLGWLATRAGTLYIQRGNHRSASESSSEITAVLNQGHNSLIFAEGTTTDGHVKKFHSRMMQSAIDAHAMVQPIAIYYPYKQAGSHEVETNPAALFIGDMSIAESADRVFREHRIDVEVHYLEPIHSKGATRDQISQHAYEEVVEAIRTIRESK